MPRGKEIVSSLNESITTVQNGEAFHTAGGFRYVYDKDKDRAYIPPSAFDADTVEEAYTVKRLIDSYYGKGSDISSIASIGRRIAKESLPMEVCRATPYAFRLNRFFIGPMVTYRSYMQDSTHYDIKNAYLWGIRQTEVCDSWEYKQITSVRHAYSILESGKKGIFKGCIKVKEAPYGVLPSNRQAALLLPNGRTVTQNVVSWDTGYVYGEWTIELVRNAVINHGATVEEVFPGSCYASKTACNLENLYYKIMEWKTSGLPYKALYQRVWTAFFPSPIKVIPIHNGRLMWSDMRLTGDVNAPHPPSSLCRPEITADIAARVAIKVVNQVADLFNNGYSVAATHVDCIHTEYARMADKAYKPGQWRKEKTGIDVRFLHSGCYKYGQKVVGAFEDTNMERMQHFGGRWWPNGTPNGSNDVSSMPHNNDTPTHSRESVRDMWISYGKTYRENGWKYKD